MNPRKSNRICVHIIPVAKMTQDLMKKQDFQIMLNFLLSQSGILSSLSLA